MLHKWFSGLDARALRSFWENFDGDGGGGVGKVFYCSNNQLLHFKYILKIKKIPQNKCYIDTMVAF